MNQYDRIYEVITLSKPSREMSPRRRERVHRNMEKGAVKRSNVWPPVSKPSALQKLGTKARRTKLGKGISKVLGSAKRRVHSTRTDVRQNIRTRIGAGNAETIGGRLKTLAKHKASGSKLPPPPPDNQYQI